MGTKPLPPRGHPRLAPRDGRAARGSRRGPGAQGRRSSRRPGPAHLLIPLLQRGVVLCPPAGDRPLRRGRRPAGGRRRPGAAGLSLLGESFRAGGGAEARGADVAGAPRPLRSRRNFLRHGRGLRAAPPACPAAAATLPCPAERSAGTTAALPGRAGPGTALRAAGGACGRAGRAGPGRAEPAARGAGPERRSAAGGRQVTGPGGPGDGRWPALQEEAGGRGKSAAGRGWRHPDSPVPPPAARGGEGGGVCRRPRSARIDSAWAQRATLRSPPGRCHGFKEEQLFYITLGFSAPFTSSETELPAVYGSNLAVFVPFAEGYRRLVMMLQQTKSPFECLTLKRASTLAFVTKLLVIETKADHRS